MKTFFCFLKKSILTESAPFVLLLGIAPLLGGTKTLSGGVALGVCALIILILSGVTVSLVGRLIPERVKDIAYMVIVAFFVTLAEMLLAAFFPDIYEALGIYLPLLAVSGILFSRTSASDGETVFSTSLSGLGMGLSFFAASVTMSFLREFFGSGTLFGFRIIPEEYAIRALVSPFGAFVLFGLLFAVVRIFNSREVKEDDGQ